MKRKGVLLSLVFALITGIGFAAVWLESDEGIGKYRYLEKDATTYVHYGTDNGGFTGTEVWVAVDSTGANYTGAWAHDAGANKHISTGNLNSASHADWDTGALIDLYCKVWDGFEETGYDDHARIIDVVNNNADYSPLTNKVSGATNLVMDFSINAGTAETLKRLWVENTGTLQEGTHISNDSILLYYENLSGADGFSGSESKVVLYGDYGSNPSGNEQWGHDALSISIPSGGIRCYLVISNLIGSYNGKTAQFEIMNDGISLNNGLVRVNAHINSTNQMAPYETWHTIPIDGVNDFLSTEVIKTTTTGFTNYMTWDSNYLYVGYYGEDVDTNDADYLIVAYLSTNGDTGSAYGVKYANQQVVLPFKADFAMNFIGTYTWDSATNGGTAWDWAGDPFTITTLTDIYRNGNFIEWRISRSELGNPSMLDIYLQFVKKKSGSEWSYAAVPDDTFSDGYQSNPSNFISFGSDIFAQDILPYTNRFFTNDCIIPATNILSLPSNNMLVTNNQSVDVEAIVWDDMGIYKVEIYTNTGVWCTFYHDNYQLTNTTNITVTGSIGDEIEFYSVAYDTRNQTNSSTNTVKFRINEPPPPPDLTFPTDGDSVFYLLKPRFKWDQTGDDDGDSVTNFEIIVSENSDLSSPVIHSVFYTDTETNYLTTFTNYLDNLTTYYWSVRGNDGFEWGDWSTTNDFTVNPQYIKLDGSLSEWPSVNFASVNSDVITNNQWRWSDATNDPYWRTVDYHDHLDLLEFGVTADENCLFFMFTVPDLSAGSPRTYVSVAIDTNLDGSGNGFINTAYSECGVSGSARWDMQVIANVDGTGYFYPSGSSTNWYEWGENWITHSANPGLGEIAIGWDEMGFESVPDKLRMTINIGRVQDGLGTFYIDELSGADYVDCVSTNSGDAQAEFTDSVNQSYVDINFNSTGGVIEDHFEVTAPATAIAGIPFEVVVEALTFYGGPMQDFKRNIFADVFVNGSAYILSNTPWVNGKATNYVVINSTGSNKVIIKDEVRTDITGTSDWLVVYRPDVRINEVCFNPPGLNADGQWIELYNKGDEDVYLSDWAIHDNEDTYPMCTVSKKVALPPDNYLVIIDGTGTDDLDFSDGRGVMYLSWGDYRLAVDHDELGLYCDKNLQDETTMLDFMAYGSDAGADDDIAVSAGIWTAGDFASITDYVEGSSLVLLPDADDNNLGTDWSVDHSPTPRWSNLKIIADNLSVVQNGSAAYRNSVVLAFEIDLIDPENDGAANGDELSNLIVCLGGSLDGDDVVESLLWNANGAAIFNHGYNNNGETNNICMGEGVYSNAINGFVFSGLSNNTIAHSEEGGFMKVFMSLRLETNAVEGHDMNPYIMSNSIIMKSSYPTPTGPVDGALSNNQKMSVGQGLFLVNEFTDAAWAGASRHQYQFLEIYNHSTNTVNPEDGEWMISTRNGEDAIPLYRGEGMNPGEMLLILPGGTSRTTFMNFYDESGDCPIVTTEDTRLGPNGLVASENPLILRAGKNILAIVDYVNGESASGYTVERIDPWTGTWTTDYSANFEASSFTNGTPGYLNGFRGVEMELNNIAAYSLDINSSNNVIMDFYIPNNNGAEDTLSMITILNNGSAIDTDIELKVWKDDAVAGFDGNETEVGDFVYQGDSRWHWNGTTTIPNTGSVDKWRFFVTANVPDTTVDGRTVRLSIESLLPRSPAPYDGVFTNGMKVLSFNDGPVDGEVSNVSTQICGIAELGISKVISTVELDLTNMIIPGALLTYKITYLNNGNGNGHNVVLYDEIPANTTYYTNYLGSATGWETQYAHIANPDQSYDSADYDSDESDVWWVRWRKALVTPEEDGKTIYIGITVD